MKFLYILIPLVICSPFNYLNLKPSQYYEKLDKERAAVNNIANMHHLPDDINIQYADSIIIRFNYWDNIQFTLSPNETYIELDGKKVDMTKNVQKDSLFQKGTMLFVNKEQLPILSTFMQDMSVIGDSHRKKEVSVTIFRKNTLEVISIPLEEWYYNTHRIFSSNFKKLCNRLTELIPDSYHIGNNGRIIHLFSDSNNTKTYKLDYQPSHLMIRYFKDSSQNEYSLLFFKNGTLEISTYEILAGKQNKLSPKKEIIVPFDSTLYESAIELFYTHTKPNILKWKRIDRFNKEPKEFLEVHNEPWDGFSGFIDTHVEDQIIEYSPEFNEFMDRLKALIEKAEKESK